jgi:hypothetical protein
LCTPRFLGSSLQGAQVCTAGAVRDDEALDDIGSLVV